MQRSATPAAARARASATVETNTPTIDVDKLLDLKPGESYGIPDEYSDFPINPERVAPILRRLISPTKTRARIFDRDGGLIIDSRNLFGRGDVLRIELGPPASDKPNAFERSMTAVRTWLNRGDLPLYRELGPVVTALLFAGRAGTSITAEIGLMRATDQLDAMEMMAVDPMA